MASVRAHENRPKKSSPRVWLMSADSRSISPALPAEIVAKTAFGPSSGRDGVVAVASVMVRQRVDDVRESLEHDPLVELLGRRAGTPAQRRAERRVGRQPCDGLRKG